MGNKIIKRIVIKSSSGYVSAEEAYEDKMVLDRKSIHYQYKPNIQTFINQAIEWSFTTSNMEYQWVFDQLSADISDILSNREKYFEMLDAGSISFSVIYEDKSKDECEIWRSPAEFQACLSPIRDFVPPGEKIPEMLKTWEDDCEENNR